MNYHLRWTAEERAKADYVALRALRRGRDPAEDVRRYMGMNDTDTALAVRRAHQLLRGEGRRRQAGTRRSAMGWAT